MRLETMNSPDESNYDYEGDADAYANFKAEDFTISALPNFFFHLDLLN